MKIKEYLNDESFKIVEALKTVEKYDYTNFEVEEVFEAVKDCFNIDDGKNIVVEINPELTSFNCCAEMLSDNKIYPLLVFTVNLKGKCFEDPNISIKLSPFRCVRIYGYIFNEIETKKKLTNAVYTFMKGKFGVDYLQKRNEYLRIVKDNQIQEVKDEANKKISMIEEKYKEDLFNM